MKDHKRHVLVADIGGTNTRVALGAGTKLQLESVRRFANAEHAGLPDILAAYLRDMGTSSCAGAAVAVAGPVQDGIAEMTNLNWTITTDAVAAVTGARTVTILNDLQAQGYALDRLDRTKLRQVITGAGNPRPGARLVIGVGTGFNAAPVHRTDRGLMVAPSECGHQSLPVRTDRDLELAASLEAEHGFAGVEDVLSGRGLARLHAWCAARAGLAVDLAPASVMGAIDGGDDPVAREAAAIFVRLLGRAAGDLALVHLPFQGVYLVGGVARAFGPHLDRFGFAQAFRDKGRFSSFMDQFPVHIVEDDFAALAGCAEHLAGIARS